MGGSLLLEGLHPSLGAIIERDLTFPNPAYDENNPSTEPTMRLWRRDAAGRYIVPRYYGGVPIDRVERGEYDPGTYQLLVMRPARENQRDVIAELEQYRGRDVGMQLPCGFGKTYLALRHAAHIRGRICVVVPNENKLDEWKKEIAKTFGLRIDEIGHVQASTNKWRNHPVTVVMLNTLAMKELDPDFYRSFASVIWDEVHLVPAAQLSGALGRITGAQIMLSATPGRGLRRTILDLHCGRSWVSRSESSEHMTFYFKLVPVSDWVRKAEQWRFQKLRIAEDKTYNRFAAEMALDCVRTENTRLLVLHSYIEPLVAMQNFLRRQGQDGGGFIVGQQSLREARGEEVMRQYPGLPWKKAAKAYFEAVKRQANPIFGTGLGVRQPAGTGMDVDDLDSGIIMLPVPKYDMVQQLVGRWNRKKEGKRPPKGIVLVPDTEVGVEYGHSMARAMRHLGVNVQGD